MPMLFQWKAGLCRFSMEGVQNPDDEKHHHDRSALFDALSWHLRPASYQSYQAVPGTHRGGSFENRTWPIGFSLRCRNDEVLKLCGTSTNKQMVVGMPMTWHERIRAQLSAWTNELMNQWVNESVSQRFNGPPKHWSNGPMKKQPVNQWMDKSVKPWLIESRNQWINKPASQ